MSEDLSALKDFCGTARLFPLPNLVLFPYVIQPLHIFEPRYRQMTADALANDRLLGLVLPRPGWETEYKSKPALHPVACLGRIVAEQRLEDGRYNLLLRGLSRARILEEVDVGTPYRNAKVELLEETVSLPPHAQKHLRDALGREVPTWFPDQSQLLDQFQKLLQSDLPLGALCDIFSFALPLDVEFKQQLLEETDVERRVRHLLEQLKTQAPPSVPAASARGFPPGFSDN
jgi:Lon protease-like protein